MTYETPTVLYKYMDVSGKLIKRVEDALHNNSLWFSSPKEFNDPFDCRCAYDIRDSREEFVTVETAYLERNGASRADALVRAEQYIPQHPDQFERWQCQKIEARSREIANTGILCLTSLRDNPLMWTHYAKWHTGVCIKFRVRNEHESHVDFIGEALPIEYVDRMPLINIARDKPIPVVRKTFLTKASRYSYEAEWRIVRYNKESGLKPIPKGIIGAVILGAEVEPATRNHVVQACVDYDGEVEIIRAILVPQTFGLRFEVETTV